MDSDIPAAGDGKIINFFLQCKARDMEASNDYTVNKSLFVQYVYT